MAEAGMEMPRYVSHKHVWALKIKDIEKRDNNPDTYSYWLVPDDAGYAPFVLSREYMAKHMPTVGGYYVVYKDGYKSFSPAQAFEEGYTRVEQ